MSKTLFFGSSFVSMFKLLQSDDIKVYKITEKKAKGISKIDDLDGKMIKDLLHENKKNIKCVVFNFGSVDVHFSFFYLLVNNNYKINYKDIYDKIAFAYVNFIHNLNCNNKIIICPYYSPIKSKNVIPSLLAYGIIDKDKINQKMLKDFVSREVRNKIVDYFNSKIKIYASKYKIRVIDINPIISSNGYINKKYIDISDYNIHLVWETLIFNYIDLLNNCGVKEDIIDLSQYDKYLKSKTTTLKNIKYNIKTKPKKNKNKIVLT